MDSNQQKLVIMCSLTLIFFLAEIIVGYIVSSLALISDAFHMLSDLLSIVVAIAALRMKEKNRTDKMTYGWLRAETLGGLINGVFLLALCFNIFIEAIQRFFEPTEVKQPVLLLIVASVGLLFNIIGLAVFAGHAGGGGSGHGHSHKHKEKADTDVAVSDPPKERSTTMHSVFLHVLGDAFGSIAVIGSALFIWLTDFSWRFYIDPALSILLSSILIKSSYRLVKATSYVILQRVPSDVDVKVLNDEIAKVAGVINVHELHVWQLDDNRNVCTVHIACRSDANFMTLGQTIKDLIHKYGVHNVTIQPEFAEEAEQIACSLACKQPDCHKRVCCTDDN